MMQRGKYGTNWLSGNEDTTTMKASSPNLTAEQHLHAVAQRKMRVAKYWYITIMVFVISTAAMITGLAFVYHYKPKQQFEITSFETRLLKPNTIMYKSIELIDPDGGVNSFFFNKLPSHRMHQVNLTQDFAVPKNHFKYWARYLNEGSKVRIKINWAHYTLTFCMVVGDLSNWLNGGRCANLITSSDGIHFEYTATESSDHYFIIEAPNDLPATLTISSTPQQLSDVENAQYTKQDESSNPLLDYQSPSSYSDSVGVNTKKEQPDDEFLTNGNELVDQLSRNLPKQIQPLAVMEDTPLQTSQPQSSDIGSRQLLKFTEAPDFWIARGNISFDLSLVQYDISQANDLYLGSFLKDFTMGAKEYIVLYNPSDTQTYKVTYLLTTRLTTLFLILVAFEWFLVVIAYICYQRIPSIPKSAIFLQKAPHELRDIEMGRLTQPYVGFGNDRGYKPKKRSNYRTQALQVGVVDPASSSLDFSQGIAIR